MPFEVLEHTAEVGLRVEAESLEGVFRDLCAGLFSLITDPSAVRPERTWEVTVEAPDRVALAVEWLNELLYLNARDGMVAHGAEVLEVSDGRLRARLHGEPFDPKRHPRGIEVKAATYHQARVEREGDRWVAVVYVDV
ncbi:MAG: archease [Armatimonadota bacterium]|nr:archease [Armatimonadota bacterium]MDR7444077.1 archease [Armatimonadota bacterium]MDR7613526.1 archease [Armatimonadota bacterium]